MSQANTRNDVLAFFVALMQKIYTAVPVRRAKQTAPATNELNIVVDLTAERNLGNEVIFLADEEKYSNAGMQSATLEIQAIGDGSLELLAQLKYYLALPSIVDLYSAANVAVNDVGQLQDLSMELDTRTWQERGSVDLTVSYSREVLEDCADWFSRLEISGTTTNGKDKEERPNADEEIIQAEITRDLE